MPSAGQVNALETELSTYYEMPIKFEGMGTSRRCLELCISLCPSSGMKCILSYMTDAERQGEGQDVTAWPSVRDPRARSVCRSMVLGLAAKIARYFGPETRGLPATLRKTILFLKQTLYPSNWWKRCLLRALLNRGIRPSVLPKCLRKLMNI